MRITLALTECRPFISCSEVSFNMRDLAKSLAEQGNEVSVILPYYKELKDQNIGMFIGSDYVQIGQQDKYVGVFTLVSDNIEFFFIDNNEYFGNHVREGYSNDGERYVYYTDAVLRSFKLTNKYPDVIHFNDWYLGLLPYMLKSRYKYKDEYRHIKTVMTIFDFNKQGIFPNELQTIIHAPDSSILKYDDTVNFMKAGLLESDKITTVSADYYDYMLGSNNRLESILRDRLPDFTPLLFGVREKLSPQDSPHIYKNFNKRNVLKAKEFNKTQFKEEVGLAPNNVMLVGFVGGFHESRGFDIFSKQLESLLNETDAQFFFLGYGEKKYEDYVNYLCMTHPERFRCYIGFTDEVRDKMLAACDMILEPSMVASCSLSTLSAMRFGSVPLVYETGANKDLIDPYNQYTDSGNGFSFSKYTPVDFRQVFNLAYGHFRFNRESWNKILKSTMSSVPSSEDNALKYTEIYKEIIK